MRKITAKIFLSVLSSAIAISMVISNFSVYGAQNSDKKIKKTITVGKNSEFTSIQAALDSVNFTPDEKNPLTIKIKKGFYEEPVTVNLPYVKFVNADSDRPEDVIISYDKANDHEDPKKKFGTQQSATVTINNTAEGFSAENITIQNSFNLNQPNLGLDGGRNQTQAVALVTMTDKVILKNCHFLGRQDTLYLKGASKGSNVYGDVNNARVYVKDCYIEGTVDYILGDATAYFDNCDLNMAFYKNGGHYTAANTTLFNTGYVFNNCRLTVDKKYFSYTGENKKNIDLGRPWQGDNTYPNYGSHTVFINCVMPDYLKSDGFSVWNTNTVSEKIRYMEYGSVNEKGEKIDLSIRPDWIIKLTDKQAENYNVYNVLRGDDGWNPAKAENTDTPVLATGITLDKYNIEIPKGESDTIKAFVVPYNAENRKYSFVSSDESIVAVDGDGNIKAVSQGDAYVEAIASDSGFKVRVNIKALAQRTVPPEVESISIKTPKSEVYPEDVITGVYSYKNGLDTAIDCAKVRFVAVNPETGEEILLQEGREDFDRQYKVKAADIGYKIRFEVLPETDTSYGDKGEKAVCETANVLTPDFYVPKTYLREGFSDFYTEKYVDENTDKYPENPKADVLWKGSGDLGDEVVPSINVITEDGNDMIAGASQSGSFMEYIPKDNEKAWGNISLEARMRFNPTAGGFASNNYFNIYTSYDSENDSYYKLQIGRGGNTNSLKLYLYKKDKDKEEVLVAKDEESLNGIVPQNAGENNPWFRVNIKNADGRITVSFRLESSTNNNCVMTYNDKEPLEGFTAIESYGKVSVLLVDSILIEECIDSGIQIQNPKAALK